MSRGKWNAAAISVSVALCGCRLDMHDQPRYRPLQASAFFSDGRSARPYVEGTVARGQLNSDAVFYTGKQGDQFIDTLPFPLTRTTSAADLYIAGPPISPSHSRLRYCAPRLLQSSECWR